MSVKLFSDSKSDYEIVVANDCTEEEKFAVYELISLFKAATGYVLKTAGDCPFDAEKKRLSVGRTEFLATCGSEHRSEAVSRDSLCTFTCGRSVFFTGAAKGVVYAVYAFFEKYLNYRFYSYDEVRIDKVAELSVGDIYIYDEPSFMQRMAGFNRVRKDKAFATRMRTEAHGTDWGFGGTHSHFRILPKEKYYGLHPDWYSPDGRQLCLSNADMREEFIERLKEYLTGDTCCRFVMLGLEDRGGFCNCDKCRKLIDKYGTPSAVDMLFVNYVARRMKEWTDLTQPGRQITYVTFAYQSTFDAPVRKSGEEYTIADESLRAEDNVAVLIAPISADYSHPLMSEHNAKTQAAFTAWSKVCGRLAVWTYGANFFCYLINFNNFDTKAADYRDFKRMGVISLFDQCTWNSDSPTFDSMRLYVQSRLMWNVDLDYFRLADEFMRQYYKDAYPFMKEYFDYIREYMKGENYPPSTLYVRICDRRYFAEEYVDKCMDIFDRALEFIEKFRFTDEEKYRKLSLRVNKERVSVLFIALSLYPEKYTVGMRKKLLDEMSCYAYETGLVRGWEDAVDKSFLTEEIIHELKLKIL